MLCLAAQRHRPTHKPIVVTVPPSCLRLSLGPSLALARSQSASPRGIARWLSFAVLARLLGLVYVQLARPDSPHLDSIWPAAHFAALSCLATKSVRTSTMTWWSSSCLRPLRACEKQRQGQLVRAERERERERRTHETTTTPTRDSTPLTRSGKPPPWHAYCGRGDSCQLEEVWCERGRASEEEGRDAHRRCWRRSGPGSRSCPSP